MSWLCHSQYESCCHACANNAYRFKISRMSSCVCDCADVPLAVTVSEMLPSRLRFPVVSAADSLAIGVTPMVSVIVVAKFALPRAESDALRDLRFA